MVRTLLDLNDPFFRTTIGFDKMFNTLEQLNGLSNVSESYPPYNLIRTGDDRFVIEVALAGFSKEELNVEIKENVLHINGEKKQVEDDGKKNYIHKGIGARKFHKTFTLAEYVEVVEGAYVDGVLTVVCERQLPEEKKPRKLDLGDSKVLLQE
tara:strand:+ start:42 stop:500 length:459 start_codon:yes stop_codon:yes gene_type:complete